MSRSIPELAGLGTYYSASRIGLSVDENVRRLLRYHWIELRLMDVLLAHLPGTPEWEVKCAMALHQWEHGERASLLRERIGEMRSPLPRLDVAPDDALEKLMAELERSEDTIELLTGIYGVLRPALASAYRQHLAESNLLVDQPTRHRLKCMLLDDDEGTTWGALAIDALIAENPVAASRAGAWRAHLSAYLTAAGGVTGSARPVEPTLPDARATSPFVPDLTPRRDARFQGQHDFDFPPHVVYDDPRVPADERNLALLCKRALEMDVPEMMASILVEWRELPWELRRMLSRQLWDEARHAMMGTVALAHRGVDFTELPLNVGFSLRLNRHAEPLERQILLFAIEQSLMPRDTGKRAEYETARSAGDELSTHFQDYDWADEVLHTKVGRAVLKHAGITPAEATERAEAIHERTWAALEAYREDSTPPDWWGRFVERVLGRPSALSPDERHPLRVLTE